MCVSKKIAGCSESSLRVLQGRFKVSKRSSRVQDFSSCKSVFQGSFKDVLRNIQGC